MPSPREEAEWMLLTLLVITNPNYNHREILEQFQKTGMHGIAQYSIKTYAEED